MKGSILDDMYLVYGGSQVMEFDSDPEQIQIPRHVISSAVMHARANASYEVAGLFAVGADGVVRYLPGNNKADNPVEDFELDSAWIAEQIVDRGLRPVCFFHSHPGGTAEPSMTDAESFPWYYVTECLIYYGDGNKLVSYDSDGWVIRIVGKDGLRIRMRKE